SSTGSSGSTAQGALVVIGLSVKAVGGSRTLAPRAQGEKTRGAIAGRRPQPLRVRRQGSRKGLGTPRATPHTRSPRTGARHDTSTAAWIATWIANWIATCPVSVRRARPRHARAGRCGGAGLPEPDDHHDRAVRGRWTDRRPGAHPRRDDAGADRPEHR